MQKKAKKIYNNAIKNIRRWSIKGIKVERILIVIVLSMVITAIFSPASSVIKPSYKVGDIAQRDVKSPYNIASGGINLKRGEMVAREGDPITQESLRKIKVISSSPGISSRYFYMLGFFLFVLIFLSTIYMFASRTIKQFASGPRDMIFMSVLLTGILLTEKLTLYMAHSIGADLQTIPVETYMYLIPAAAGAMMTRLFLSSETAIVFAIVTSILSGIFLGNNPDIAAYFLVGGIVGSMEVRHCIQRSTILKAGLILGILNSAVIVSLSLIRFGALTGVTAITLIVGFSGGILTAVVVTGLTPIFEIVFGYTTNIKLLELSRMDHPLLKQLAIQAPGTYHHSLMIGSLVETAAEAINANPLLARVGAYYHDIGKGRMPLYFIENMKGENKHDKLAPSMSALILIKHTKEGKELARKYRLGNEITNIIEQHHGTSLIRFFYDKARERGETESGNVEEANFRYPGPKPQTKEAGLVMLADSIEAASRTLPDPTPAKIKGMVQKIINKIFTDGQLDECELTLRDLNAIARSFDRVLNGIFHQRIEYSEPAYITREKNGGGNDPKQVSKKDKNGKDKEHPKDGIRRLGSG